MERDAFNAITYAQRSLGWSPAASDIDSFYVFALSLSLFLLPSLFHVDENPASKGEIQIVRREGIVGLDHLFLFFSLFFFTSGTRV